MLLIALLVLALGTAPSMPHSLFEPLAAYGVAPALAHNTLWSALGVLLVWSMIALGVKRLRDRGRSPWWIVVVAVPPLLLALNVNNAFLASTGVVVGPLVRSALLIDSAAIGLWVLAECLVGPAHDAAASPAENGGGVGKVGDTKAGDTMAGANGTSVPRMPRKPGRDAT